MKQTFLSLAVAFSLLTACKGSGEKEATTSEAKEVATADSVTSDKYTVDAAGSEVKWSAYKTGAKHSGHVMLGAGELMLKDGNIESGSFAINLESLVAEDGDKESNEKLTGHLKSPDFFDAANHKEAKFEITSVTKTNGDSANVSGNLTIKDSTVNIVFPAAIKVENGVLNATAKFAIDRSKWGLVYQPADKIKLKDKFIKDNIDLELKLTAKK